MRVPRTPKTSALLAVCIALVLGAAVLPAQAQVYFTPRSVLAAFFPGSQRVTYRTFTLSPEQRARLTQRLGAPPPKSAYNFYVALSGENVDGYALLDEARGQYMPISFAVKLSPKGAVERLEIMVYREQYGSEVKSDRFCRQFAGKTLADPLLLGDDVLIVSGASVSSRALTDGVRRSLILFDELFHSPSP